MRVVPVQWAVGKAVKWVAGSVVCLVVVLGSSLAVQMVALWVAWVDSTAVSSRQVRQGLYISEVRRGESPCWLHCWATNRLLRGLSRRLGCGHACRLTCWLSRGITAGRIVVHQVGVLIAHQEGINKKRKGGVG